MLRFGIGSFREIGLSHEALGPLLHLFTIFKGENIGTLL